MPPKDRKTRLLILKRYRQKKRAKLGALPNDEADVVPEALGRWPRSFVRYLSPNEKRVWTNLYYRRLKERDPHYLIVSRLRARLTKALKRAGAQKCAGTFELVGCSAKRLRRHLESLFLPGMTWENRELWHIDHRTPMSAFDLRLPSEQKKAMHYRNLRPIWREDNREKWDRLPDGTLARNHEKQLYLPGF